MDRFETAARLEWRAHSSMHFGPFDVAVTVAAVDGWDVRAKLTKPEVDNQGEAFEFLCDLDPAFLLTFPDGSSFPVLVESLGRGSAFHLKEIPPPGSGTTSASVDGPSTRDG